MPAQRIPTLAQFAELCQKLTETSRKLEKRSLIAEYLHSLSLQEGALGALYLTGAPFPDTERRVLNVGGALLTRVIAELSGASPSMLHAAYLRHGDLGTAAYDLLQGLSVAPTLELGSADTAFTEIATAQKPGAKQRLVLALLRQATPLEAKYLIKIMLGDMRTGVKESLVEEAIAAAYGAEIGRVRRATMLRGSIPEVLNLAARGQLEKAKMKLFHPLGFMLASPVETVAEALERFSPEIEAEGLGTRPLAMVTEAQMEDKYDGIRTQVHAGDPEQPGRVALFSRSKEDITASFPEIVEAFSGISEPLILDGEILAWHRADQRESSPPARQQDGALPFASLQSRLGRKRVTAEMRRATPVVFMVFDLLYAGGELMLDRPLQQRRQALEGIVARVQPRTRVGTQLSGAFEEDQAKLQFDSVADDGFPRLVLAPAVRLESPDQLEHAYRNARDRGNEGVMLKARHSRYEPGRRGFAWLKLKRELATLDVVVTAAEYGHGKRAGVLSDYTFAVRDGELLRVVGKAYSGLTDAEIAMLTQFFREHTIEGFGSARRVEPSIVLEVAFNNVMRSERHDSGFALRFPRIVRIREDKPVNEIDTLERVAEIYQSQPDRPLE